MPKDKPKSKACEGIDYKKMIISVLIVEVVGNLGSVFVAGSLSGWYMRINKPSFTPPGEVIGFVWTFLYFLMGMTLYLIWTSNARKKEWAIALFAVQLALNFLWSFFFFYLKSPLYGLVEIVVLWFAILATIMAFYRISKHAAVLLVPYLIWVSFAMLLTYSVFMLNP